MSITFIAMTMLLKIAIAETNEKLMIRQELGWKEEVKFWSNVACRAGRRRILSLFEISKRDRCRRLNLFFGDLVTNVQTLCSATTRTKAYRHVESTYDQKYLGIAGRSDHDGISNKIPIAIEEHDQSDPRSSVNGTFIFPQKDVEILLVLMEESINIPMNGNIFEKWDNRRHVIVLMITEEQETASNAKKQQQLLVDTFVNLLQRMWNEYRVLNVFFAAPLSSLGHLVWFYDPFIKNETTGLRGKIIARRVWDVPNVDRIKNLYGYRLNIGLFEESPAVIKCYSTASCELPFVTKAQGFVGIDGLTMATIADLMNFTFKIVSPMDGIRYGYVRPNGTFTGTIGDAAYHRIDIGFNSMYWKIYNQHEYSTNTIEFSSPIDFDRVCIVVPRAEKIPRWLRTFYYFHPAIWLCLIIAHIIVALFWYFVRNNRCGIAPKRTNIKSSYGSLLLSSFSLFIGSPIIVRASKVEKLILAGFMLFGVTMMGTFTGTLYHCFTHEMYYNEIRTLKELDESGLRIKTASPNLKDVFGLHEMLEDPEEIKSLRNKLTVMDPDEVPMVERTAHERNVASLSRENVFAIDSKRYVDDKGESLIHLVEECPRAYYLSYVVPKNSWYIQRLNILIGRLLQAGLPLLWNSVTTGSLINIEKAATISRISNTQRLPFNLRDMQTSFLLLSIGHAISVCIFIVEIIYYYRSKIRNYFHRAFALFVFHGDAK